MKVGFIGLGTMGSSMAYNALQGGSVNREWEMVVHDIRREAATRHLEAGAEWGRHPQGGGRGQRDCVHVSSRPHRGGGRGPW